MKSVLAHSVSRERRDWTEDTAEGASLGSGHSAVRRESGCADAGGVVWYDKGVVRQGVQGGSGWLAGWLW